MEEQTGLTVEIEPSDPPAERRPPAPPDAGSARAVDPV